MASKQSSPHKVAAVLGAGRFGTAVANLVAPNVERLFLYAHRAEQACAWQASRRVGDVPLAANVVVSNDLEMVLRICSVIFPVVPAAQFRGLMQQIAPAIRPDHLLIHGTKGLHIYEDGDLPFAQSVATMSRVMVQETKVQAVGCLAGPNLSAELAQKHPAVAVVASASRKVLAVGEQLLTNPWFRVYTSVNLNGVEMCNVLKNIFAIGAGIIGGMGYGANTYAFFITMAISEMDCIMAATGTPSNGLLGPAGLGDLIATCGSTTSRNYTIGYRLAKGEQLTDILKDVKGVSEGVQTVQTICAVMQSYGKQAPITEAIYRMLFEELPVQKGLDVMLGG
ncbi:NAD(P)H-dependent glycerol-3-phosphate dehydrogenase [Cardinium endosymbiont of Nabis limbatus]|uniref:NAD(P)H-dependent glycerol-3-phosphate dehydrogenase n=1 Tax=Cardinium endosymbiont of Nabis limbatus TaxID=3066217 RepID=UPI003AF3BCF8